MYLLAHETEEEVRAAAVELRNLGASARRLLEQCVELQGLTRKTASRAAQLLNDAGFVFIHDSGDMWQAEVTIKPSLAGEEALEALEQIEEAESKPKISAKKVNETDGSSKAI